MPSINVRLIAVSGALAVAAAAAHAEPLQSIGEPEGFVDIVAWPGYIERGDTDPAYDWVTGFEEQSGCQVRVKTANTSDEMVALMNEGGFDLVTASGDASLRLIAGDRVQEINTEPDPELEHGRSAPAGCALAHGRRQALRRALSVGLERPDVQHRGVSGAARELERRVRGDDAARRQVEQGTCAGLRRSDLHRRCRALPDAPPA